MGEAITRRQAAGNVLDAGFLDRSGWMSPMGGGDLAVDMFETNDDLVVSTTLPGVKPDDVEITVTGDALCITAESKADSVTESATFYEQERRYGVCSRSLILPVAVQVDKAEAKFKDGVLTLTLPKADTAKPRAIKVNTASK
jgi:HSP20 family protein